MLALSSAAFALELVCHVTMVPTSTSPVAASLAAARGGGATCGVDGVASAAAPPALAAMVPISTPPVAAAAALGGSASHHTDGDAAVAPTAAGVQVRNRCHELAAASARRVLTTAMTGANSDGAASVGDVSAIIFREAVKHSSDDTKPQRAPESARAAIAA